MAALTGALAFFAGGREVGDDAVHLLELVSDPWILFRAPDATALPPTWRSFPPLLPLGFGLLVRPWLAVVPEFVAIRLGVLAWAVIALVAFDRVARASGLGEDERRRGLWIFALLPSLAASLALLPQEEIYVALFAMALFAAGRAQRFGLFAAAAAAAVLGGKILLAALVVPVACSAPRPLRELARAGGAMALAQGAWLGWQTLAHGQAPLLSYSIDPVTSISPWGALAGAGWRLSPELTRALSGALGAAGVLAVGGLVLRGRLPALHGCALALFVPLLALPIAMPPYLVWNLPFLALVAARMPRARRAWTVALLAAWGGIAYACKILAGVALALERARPDGKPAIARLVTGRPRRRVPVPGGADDPGGDPGSDRTGVPRDAPARRPGPRRGPVVAQPRAPDRRFPDPRGRRIDAPRAGRIL